MSPDEWTLRELSWMHDARARSDWNHTAALMCLIANAHSGGKKKFTVDDFHPMNRARKPSIMVGAKALKNILGL